MDRPTILVDLDGVVYPWVEAMAVGLNSHGWTQHAPQDLVNLYRSWEIWEDWDIPKGQFDYWWEHLIRDGFMYVEGYPHPEAVAALWTLSDAECHIHIVTARLNKFRLHDEVVIHTAEWLKMHQIPYRSLTFAEDKDLVMGDVIVDDNIGNLITHPAGRRFLFPAPHNRNADHIESVGHYTSLREEDPWADLLEELL
jgi:5'(3')-deoxyribonucleotidase